MDPIAREHLARLLELQEAVVSRQQVLGAGCAIHDLQRLLRRREVVGVHPGVYVGHTGPLTRRQREWAAVLACRPAALTGWSVMPGYTGETIHVAVDHRRTVAPLAGVRVHRTAGLDERVLWQRSPPRMAIEHAALDLAAAMAAEDRITSAFSLLAEVCGTRQTTPERLIATLSGRQRVPARRLLADLLDDLATGSNSVLEWGFVHRVERPHGLPIGRRQRRVRSNGRTWYTDVDYEGLGVVLELDGRAFHDGPRARDRDASRDLDTLIERDAVTPRLTWGLVFDESCHTAVRLGRLLSARGWSGVVTTCPVCAATGLLGA